MPRGCCEVEESWRIKASFPSGSCHKYLMRGIGQGDGSPPPKKNNLKLLEEEVPKPKPKPKATEPKAAADK